MHFCIVNYYTEFAKDIYHEYNGFKYLLHISTLIIIFFIIPILIDKIRIFCFNHIWKTIERNCPERK